MKILMLISTISALLSTNLNTNNVGSVTKTPLKLGKITSFDDFIYTLEDKQTYYTDVDGLQGEALILQLEDIISQNNRKPSYSGKPPVGGESWSNYYLLDRDYEKSPLTAEEIAKIEAKDDLWWQYKNIYCEVLYESESILFTGTGPNTGGSTICDREHIYPKSYGFNEKGSKLFENIMAGCDMHNLHMGESAGNQKGHNDLPYGNVTSNPVLIESRITGDKLTKKGNRGGVQVFEPMDKEKGDIARSIFYMATRYHTYRGSVMGTDGKPLGESPRLMLGDDIQKEGTTVTPSQSQTQDTVYGILTDLCTWTVDDIVSEHEQIRNTLCEKYIQGNRNPFIDFPKWVDVCFNPDTIYVADTTKPDGVRTLTSMEIDESTKVSKLFERESEIDLSELNFNYIENNVASPIEHSKLTYTLTNTETLESTEFTSSDKITLSKQGKYKLTAKYVGSDLQFDIEFEVLNGIKSILNGEFKKYYEGDTLKVSDFTLLDKDNKPLANDYSYILYNVETGDRENVTNEVKLNKGTYKLIVQTTVDGVDYCAISEDFSVGLLQETVKLSHTFKDLKVGQKMDLNNINFTYIRNQELVTVPASNLTVKMVNKTEEKTYDVTSDFTLKTKGDYELKVSTKTPEGNELSASQELKVTQTPFWETDLFKSIVIAAGIVLALLIIILIFCLIFKKKRKK